MIDLISRNLFKYKFYIIGSIVASLVIAIVFRINFIVFLIYFIIIAGYISYSYIALDQIKTYGYVGEFCREMKKIYIVISVINIVVTITLLLIFSMS